MAKLHSYYVTNVASELKYANIDITNNEKQIEDLIRICQFGNQESNEFEEFNEFKESNEKSENKEYDKSEDDKSGENNEFEDNESEEEDVSEEFEETQEINILNNIDNYFNFNNDEFWQVLNMNISVIIELYELEISNNDTKFDANDF
ncbi:18748_t:CDS:1 [Racocetra fulgida]|uniref:18748_t:CDS:1 n=1 Tax=Racocetra fulgida TaxID=60492 RepID=A0A9N9JC97_9GLOM|nr:18748_t:CDS:1 [Racocetra fulgida]